MSIVSSEETMNYYDRMNYLMHKAEETSLTKEEHDWWMINRMPHSNDRGPWGGACLQYVRVTHNEFSN